MHTLNGTVELSHNNIYILTDILTEGGRHIRRNRAMVRSMLEPNSATTTESTNMFNSRSIYYLECIQSLSDIYIRLHSEHLLMYFS